MNNYIRSLKKQNKLSLSIDKKNNFFNLKKPFIIAGPCSIESEEMLFNISKQLKKMGVQAIRAGAYKPCTFPVKKKINGWQEGLKKKGLEMLIKLKKNIELPIVSEILSIDQLDEIADEAIDIIQVGTRNFQNYPLLDELGKIDKPIILKRGTWGTIDEILGSAERILYGGNTNLMICLRGVIGMPSYRHVFPSIRWSPDIMMIPALKELTNIPIIYDPSHSTGYRNFVSAVSKSAIAAGADGLIIEAHPNPPKSISDADQAITIKTLKEIIEYSISFSKTFNK
jgi:3-deoxy-7-phosphoheptulonate synthase